MEFQFENEEKYTNKSIERKKKKQCRKTQPKHTVKEKRALRQMMKREKRRGKESKTQKTIEKSVKKRIKER